MDPAGFDSKESGIGKDQLRLFDATRRERGDGTNVSASDSFSTLDPRIQKRNVLTEGPMMVDPRASLTVLSRKKRRDASDRERRKDETKRKTHQSSKPSRRTPPTSRSTPPLLCSPTLSPREEEARQHLRERRERRTRRRLTSEDIIIQNLLHLRQIRIQPLREQRSSRRQIRVQRLGHTRRHLGDARVGES